MTCSGEGWGEACRFAPGKAGEPQDSRGLDKHASWVGQPALGRKAGEGREEQNAVVLDRSNKAGDRNREGGERATD